MRNCNRDSVACKSENTIWPFAEKKNAYSWLVLHLPKKATFTESVISEGTGIPLSN